MTPQIREAPLETVWRIRREVLYPERTLDGIKLADDDAGSHWGVFINEEAVSVISLFESGDVSRFRKFATLLHEQNKGYGSLLLGHIMAQAQGKVIWCNARTSALSLYERFGMRPVGPTWEDQGYTYIKMEKWKSYQP
jgi:phosphoribosylformimino-5-aminoimidazole carboxamide ribotide isomerase